MPKVRVLDKELSELIAAGEVIERPCSVIKELIENSIDSGAAAITVEIKRGGISYIRITDNGCAMSYEDVPTAFLRHATSKLSVKDDLTKIMTLGFRGEALASISAVAKCDVLTKPKGEELGTHYIIEGTEEKLYERTGCPDGTTIIIRDIFYNVPARLKFLKKDQYEGNAIANIVSKIAISHPEISFRFIRDNKQELFTPGDNRLYSAVYSVLGKEFAASMLPVDYTLGGINIYGYTVKPLFGKKNRTMQHFFVNGRYIKSITCMGALDEAYRNSIMEGKYPACVLFLNIPPDVVDVNVHPAKTEIRFADDKVIYDALFFAVKNALLADQKPAEIIVPEHKKTAADYVVSEFRNEEHGGQTELFDTSKSRYVGNVKVAEVIDKDNPNRFAQISRDKNSEAYKHPVRIEEIPKDFAVKKTEPAVPMEQQLEMAVMSAEKSWDKEEKHEAMSEVKPIEKESTPTEQPAPISPTELSAHLQSGYKAPEIEKGEPDISELKTEPAPEFKYINESSLKQQSAHENEQPKEEPKKEVWFRIIGEAFKNYAIAETEDGIIIVDKHAAHERIRFERLRTGREQLTAQMLLCPQKLLLDYNDYDALISSLRVCADCGFDIEPLEAPNVLIKGIPSMLDGNDAEDIVTELARNFAAHRHDPLPEILDDMYHTMACRGAIKANDVTDIHELKQLVKEVLCDERIRYCPHGRPVMFKLTKKELEKQFRRIV